MMHQPPRKAKESLFAGGGLACTCFYGILIAVISLTAFLMVPLGALRETEAARLLELFRVGGLKTLTQQLAGQLGRPEILMRAQTYAFTVLGMSQLFHAVGMRNIRKSFFAINHLENKLMIAACIIGFLLQFAVTKQPFLIEAFGTIHLDVAEWLKLAVLASFPLIAHELMALLYRCQNREK